MDMINTVSILSQYITYVSRSSTVTNHPLWCSPHPLPIRCQEISLIECACTGLWNHPIGIHIYGAWRKTRDTKQEAGVESLEVARGSGTQRSALSFHLTVFTVIFPCSSRLHNIWKPV